jgi:hypothetical protein
MRDQSQQERKVNTGSESARKKSKCGIRVSKKEKKSECGITVSNNEEKSCSMRHINWEN